MKRFAPAYKGYFGFFRTPVKVSFKNGKPTRWTYDIQEEFEPKSGETMKYYKGLGTWDSKDLEFIIEKDGLENMIELFNFDSDKIMSEFLATEESDARKQYILNNDFSIAKI